jgi:hypothetical protein
MRRHVLSASRANHGPTGCGQGRSEARNALARDGRGIPIPRRPPCSVINRVLGMQLLDATKACLLFLATFCCCVDCLLKRLPTRPIVHMCMYMKHTRDLW